MALSKSGFRRILALPLTLLIMSTLNTPASGQVSAALAQQPQRKQSKFQPLEDVIQATIAPNTWDDVGGEGSIIIVETWGVAVVSQTQYVHDEIDALLSTIRRVRQQQNADHNVSVDQTRPSAVHRIDDLKKRDQIEAALDAKTEVSFLDTPLKAAIESLEQRHQIQIEIDARALEDSGLTVDPPVTKSLSDISLRSALRLMLRDLGLTFLIEDEVLQITTPEEAETRLMTVVYPVKDLAAAVE